MDSVKISIRMSDPGGSKTTEDEQIKTLRRDIVQISNNEKLDLRFEGHLDIGSDFDRLRRASSEPFKPRPPGFDIHQAFNFVSEHCAALLTGGIAIRELPKFVRELIGVIADWRKAFPKGEVEIVVQGKKVVVRQGASAEEVVRDIETALKK